MTTTKNQVENVWSQGRYEKIGSKLIIVAETLCEEMALRAGSEVLDVGTGHGNAAMAAARRECKVSGIDTEIKLLDIARKRAEIEMLDVKFSVSNAECMEFTDNKFDYVLSTFGVQFSNKPNATAQEIIRVLKPNGFIGFANWMLEGFAQQFAEIIASFSISKPAVSPYLWADEIYIREIFNNKIKWVENSNQIFSYRFPKIEDWFLCFENTYGPIRTLCQQLDKNQYLDLREKINTAVSKFNIANDGSLVLPVPYKRQIAKIHK